MTGKSGRRSQQCCSGQLLPLRSIGYYCLAPGNCEEQNSMLAYGTSFSFSSVALYDYVDLSGGELSCCVFRGSNFSKYVIIFIRQILHYCCRSDYIRISENYWLRTFPTHHDLRRLHLVDIVCFISVMKSSSQTTHLSAISSSQTRQLISLHSINTSNRHVPSNRNRA